LTPTCTTSEGRVICGTPLERTPSGWRCPVCDFWYIVRRGEVVSGPLLSPPKGLVEEERPAEVKPAPEETFEEWLEGRGITEEMYKGLDKSTTWELRMAYNQRHKKDAEFVVLPPQH